jgi:integrase
MAKLTAKAVEAIKPAADRQEIPDALLPGLYLIVQPSGARSWAVRYRHGDRTRKLTLGPFPALDLKAARERGAKALRAAAEGRDPGQEKRNERGTVEDVVEQFLDRYSRHNHSPRTRKESERLLRLYILSPWGGRPANSISRAEVRDMLDRLMADDTPVLANRVHSIARKLFGWAVEQDIISVSPLAGLKAPAVEKSRDRVLTDPELRRVWSAAGETTDPVYGAMVRFLILTGQRRGEVAGLKWSELDLKARLWTLPKERTKNSRAHDVPLSRQAIAVIGALPRTSDHYVFSPTGKAAINGFGKPKVRLDKLCGLSDWTVHDIRRSVASGMARLGVSLPVIEKVLNHTSGSFAGIVGVYQRHDFAAEKRAALDAWSNHIAAIAAGKAAKVVSLR